MQVRKQQLELDMEQQTGKGVCPGCMLSPCLFNLDAEYIVRNAGLEEVQAGIKIAGRNINNLIYADDTTLTAESEEELKSLLMKVKEESEKTGFKLNIEKPKIMESGPMISWQTEAGKVETVTHFIFLESKYSLDVFLSRFGTSLFMSSSNCCFLICIQISQEAGQVVWYSHLLKNFPQFVVIQTVKAFGVVNKAKVDVFMELFCFFDDPVDFGSLISGSSAFSKSSSRFTYC